MITASEAREISGPTQEEIDAALDGVDVAIRTAAAEGKHRLRLSGGFWGEPTTRRWRAAQSQLEALGFTVAFDEPATVIRW